MPHTLADAVRGNRGVDPRTGQSRFNPAIFRRQRPQIRTAPEGVLRLLTEGVEAFGQHRR